MADRLKNVLKQLLEFWRGLSTTRRLALVFVVGTVLSIGIGVALYGSREHFSVLYSDLSAQDAAGIVEKLDAQKIPYRLEANGTMIQVPEDRVHALRLELAKSGLPRGGGVGFELFDKSQIGATEFEQRVSLRRALEGELSRSIITVEGVQAARVHLVLPERRLFAAQDEKASASVVLKLRNPASFGKREVAAIVHLVSAAVPGLSRERVSVVSTEGLTLHRPSSDANAPNEAADLQSEQARAVASSLEQLTREQLERVVGAGNADVRINVDLDPATRERTEEHYDHDKTALRSENKVEELSGVEGAGVAGVPGARTNLPDAEQPGAAPAEETLASGGNVLRRSQTRNWEVDRVTEKTNLPPGEIRRVSVAVLLNGKYEQKNGHAEYIARSSKELAALEEIVRRAVGFDEKRGDSIKLENMEFSRPGDEPMPPPNTLDRYRKYLPFAAGAFALLFLISVVILIKRKKPAKKNAASSTPALPKPQNALPDALPPEAIAALLAEPNLGSEEFKTRAMELAQRDPATAAVVLKKWLNAGTAAP